MLRRDYDYFAAGGGVSLDVSILWVSVVVLVPSGVVTVVSFLTSAFLSQPTVNGTTRLKAKQRVKNRFIIEYSSFGEIDRCQTSWLVLFAIDTIHHRADLELSPACRSRHATPASILQMPVRYSSGCDTVQRLQLPRLSVAGW